MKLKLKAGSTSRILRVFVRDSSVTTGVGLTGLAFDTASLVAYYIREGAAAATAITLVTATVGTYTSGGFKEISSANMPGLYELHIPDAALAAAAKSVTIMLKGAASMSPVFIEIELDAVDYQDAVGLGLSRLDLDVADVAAAAAALVLTTPANKLVTDGSGRVTAASVVDKADFALSSASRLAVADNVLDEALSGHTTAGTLGNYISRVGTAATQPVGPYVRGGAIQIVRGDDYYEVDNREIRFSEPVDAAYWWPNLTGATIEFSVWNKTSAAWVSSTADVDNAGTPGAQQVFAVPDAADTSAMDAGVREYRFLATLATSLHIVTLIIGQCTIKEPS